MGLVVHGSEIAVLMSGAGTAVIDLPGLVISGTLTARIEQTGSLTASQRRTEFVAEGECLGTGYRDFVSATTEIWAAYRAEGTTAAG